MVPINHALVVAVSWGQNGAMNRRPKISRMAAVLAALWLCAQLVSAFHLGHDEQPHGPAAVDHSCLLCKVAVDDDVIAPSPMLLAVAISLLAFLLVVVPAGRIGGPQAFQARAPPTI